MFKKIASLVLAASMMIGTAAITASAAETSAEEPAAVSADESSEVGADSSSEVGAANTVKFDVKKSGWNLETTKKVFCHIWRADSTGTWPEWQTKAELCSYDKTTGIAEYDLSKTGNDIKASDGRVYCVIFSANTGMQTCNVIMSGACIGDTLYCTGEQSENPEDSEKKDFVAKWEKTADCGQEKKITSTGNIVGTAFPDGESNVTLVAQYLIQYYNDPAKTDLTQNIINELNVSPVDVMAVVKKRLADDPDGKMEYIEKVLTACTDPTKGGEKVDADEIKNVEAAGNDNNSNNNNSSNDGNDAGTVKSGVETTILFVCGGLMLAAAGMTFLARKKREE